MSGTDDGDAGPGGATRDLSNSLSQASTSNPLGGRAQFNRPALTSGQVFVGGLQNTFYAFSRSDLESVGWTKDRANKTGLSDSSGHIWTEPSQPVIFFGSGQGELFALETDDATEYWSGQDIPDLGSAVTSGPTSTGDLIFAGTNDGRVIAWDAPTASRQWEVSVDGGVYSKLKTDGSFVYVTTENGSLHVLDATNGTEQWNDDRFAPFGGSSPTLGGSRVYVAADDVYAFDAGSSKNLQWSYSGYGGNAGSAPTYSSSNASVYVGSADKNLYSIDESSGTKNWTYTAGGTVASTPAVNDAEDRIAAVSMDGTLALLDTTGTLKDTASIPADTRASPVIDNGELFLPTHSGVVYKFV